MHRIYLNDTYLGKGLDKDGFSVPRLSSAEHSVLVQFRNLSILADIEKMMNKKELNYRVESDLHVEGRWRPIKVTSEGSFSRSSN